MKEPAWYFRRGKNATQKTQANSENDGDAEFCCVVHTFLIKRGYE